MKASELIRELSAIINHSGDMEVCYEDQDSYIGNLIAANVDPLGKCIMLEIG